MENKPIVITCRVSKAEEEAIDKKAAAAGLTRSQYVRLVCLNANLKISI